MLSVERSSLATRAAWPGEYEECEDEEEEKEEEEEGDGIYYCAFHCGFKGSINDVLVSLSLSLSLCLSLSQSSKSLSLKHT